MVQQMAVQRGGGTVQGSVLVDEPRLIVMGGIAAKQAQLVVGIPTAAAQGTPEEEVAAREPVADRRRRACEERLDFGGEGGSDALIGVEEEHPRAGTQPEGVVALGGEPAPRGADDAGTVIGGDSGAVVGGALVEQHQHLISQPGHACQATRELASLVAGDDRHGELHQPWYNRPHVASHCH